MGKQSREKWERRTGGNENAGKETNITFLQNLEKVCLFIITWGAYLLLFAPLIVIKESFFPFVTPKTIFFNAMVEIILTAYLFLAVSHPRYRPKLNILTVTIAIFIGILVLTSVTGINFSRSFWSTHERMTGLFTMFHLFAFFLVLSSVFKRRIDWEKILGVSVIVGILVSLYVLSGMEISTRGGSTIGNTSFMAAYLLFDVFFALILLLSKKDFLWQIFSSGSLAILVWVLLFSSARGAVAAFFFGLFLLLLTFFAFSRIKILKRAAIGLILLSIVFSLVAAFSPPDFLKEKIDFLISVEMRPRFAVWNIAFDAFRERPLLGWGPENFHVAFVKYFKPCMFLGECGGEIWFDRAHNIFFDTVISSGLIGLFSYLSIFIVSLIGILRAAKRISDKRSLFLPLGAGALLVAYFLQNFFVFDMINSYLVFFLTLAFIGFIAFREQPQPELSLQPRVVPKFIFAAIIAVFSLIFWFGNVNQAMSAAAIFNFLNPETSLEESIANFKVSVSVLMEKYEARENFSRRLSQLVPVQDEKDSETISRVFAIAEEEFAKGARENPLDFRTYLFLGKLYSTSYQFSGNKDKLKLSEETLKKAIQLSPANQQGYWFLGEVMLAEGRNKEALEFFQKAIDVEPRYGRSHWLMAMAYKISGDNKMAEEKIKDSSSVEYGYDWQNNFEELSRAIQIYYALKDDAGLIPLLEKALAVKPDSSQLFALLASSYANVGRYDQAEVAARKAASIDPSIAPSVEKFIKSLPR
ncbi:MAG: O-antigen ligase family protein [Candidatus Nealsonbacteria bacterium]|nr:O-antigen ligase family protein [Candidatus Nealsonbacteria bacterium]